MIRVSTPHREYSQERMIFVDHGDHDVVVRRERDIGSVWNGLQFRVTRRLSPWYALHVPPPFSRADLFHLYNAASLARRPWVVTVENYPFSRLGPIDREALAAGPSCKRVLALSRWVKTVYERMLEPTAQGRRILAKMEVLPPPQGLLDPGPENDDGVTRLCLVGSSFFRKGGLEVLRVLDRLWAEGAPLELTIVSNLLTESYPPGTEFTATDLAEARQLIDRHPRTVTWHRRLPNAEALETMRHCDVGLLPSYFDTYGYSALEMMAAGLPMVVTDQRALGEIVTPDRGWIVKMPLNAAATIDRTTEAARREASGTMRVQLEEILRAVADSPSEVRARGRRAREYVAEAHDPATYASRLREIYLAAVADQG